MDVVSVLFFCGVASVPGRQVAHLNHMERVRMTQCIGVMKDLLHI